MLLDVGLCTQMACRDTESGLNIHCTPPRLVSSCHPIRLPETQHSESRTAGSGCASLCLPVARRSLGDTLCRLTANFAVQGQGGSKGPSALRRRGSAASRTSGPWRGLVSSTPRPEPSALCKTPNWSCYTSTLLGQGGSGFPEVVALVPVIGLQENPGIQD